MKALLIIFLSFHFDGGASSESVPFETIGKCEAARSALIAEHLSKNHTWGRRNITAICVAQ